MFQLPFYCMAWLSHAGSMSYMNIVKKTMKANIKMWYFSLTRLNFHTSFTQYAHAYFTHFSEKPDIPHLICSIPVILKLVYCQNFWVIEWLHYNGRRIQKAVYQDNLLVAYLKTNKKPTLLIKCFPCGYKYKRETCLLLLCEFE